MVNRNTDLIRISKDLKIEIKNKKGNDTYNNFLKKLVNINKGIK